MTGAATTARPTAGEVGLVVAATGNYRQFLPELVASAHTHVRGLSTVFVLSDAAPALAAPVPVVWLPWGHGPWPFGTLLRSRALVSYAAELGCVDVLLHCDADLRFVGPVDVRDVEGLFAVQHPGYAGRPRADFPYETRPESAAFVPADRGTVYVAGGVQGGPPAAFLDACAVMAGWAQTDLDRGLIPVWHDESLWNRYCIEWPPATVLDTSYCRPDTDPGPAPRILALTKDHDAVRGVALPVRLARRARRFAGRARRKVRSLAAARRSRTGP